MKPDRDYWYTRCIQLLDQRDKALATLKQIANKFNATNNKNGKCDCYIDTDYFAEQAQKTIDKINKLDQ